MQNKIKVSAEENKKKLRQLNQKSSQYLWKNNIIIDHLVKRPEIFNFFDSMMLDEKTLFQKNNSRIENRVKSGQIFSSFGKKHLTIQKVSISKQLLIFYNEYKHCLKKLNTDIILNENIFLMKIYK